MDSSSGYGSWSMTSNSNPEFAWQFGANGVPQAAASSNAIPHTAHSEFLGLQAQMMHQQPQAYQFQPAHSEYQQQVFPQYFTADPTRNRVSASSGVPPNSSSVDANTFHQLQAAFPSAPPGMLADAVFPRPQQQQQQQQQQQHPDQHQHAIMHHSQSPGLQPLPQSLQPPPSYAQAPSHHTLFRSHSDSDNSLAHALTFTSPQPPPSLPSPSISLAQQSLPSSSTSTGYPNVAAPSLATPSNADTKKKAVKLRQSKLTFLPGVAQSVVKKTSPASAPAAATTAKPSSDGPGATVVVDTGSEPGTPPLPKAKALVAKPSTNGTTSRAAVAKSSSPSAPLEGKRISDLARRYLVRLNVEQKPKTTARQLVELLSDLGPSGKFLRPTPTNGEDRKIIVEALNSIAKLETGKGYTESGRKRFFEALMDLPAARHILSAWLKATAPPKKVTEATPDHSRRYKDTLLPLLNILDYVDMKSAYLTDEAAMGKSISGVVNRAVDPSAKAFANKIKAKWSKMIDEEAKGAGPARPASTTSATASTSTAAAASAKRKPAESGAGADSAKRYKSATATPTTASASARAPKPAAGASSSANAKPGLSFFGASNARRPTSTATSSNSNAGLASGSRMNIHQNIMSLMNKYSGGAATDRTAASTANAPQADVAAAKTKVKKRVIWKADNELVAVKLIEPADYGQCDDDEDHHVEGAGDVHDEGLALRQSLSTMEALINWHKLREVMVTVCDAGPIGSESVEGPFQTQRSANREERSNAADEDELISLDESQLEQPGCTSETPSELVGVENVDMPTPWMGETGVEEPDTMDVKKEGDDDNHGGETDSAAPAMTIAGVPSTADLSALLSVAQSVGVGANAGGTEANKTGSAAAAPAPVPNFDLDQLRSIIANARGSGSPPSAANAVTAVNAAIQASNERPANLSSLLTSLSKTHAALPSQRSVEVHQEPNYWQQTYRGSNGSNYAPPEESYPGEYQQSYQPAAQRYGRSAPSHDYAEYTQGNSRDRGASDWGIGGRQSKQFKTPCKFFAQGTCRNGDRCTFLH